MVTFKAAKQVVIEEFERTYVARALDEAGGNVTKAAAMAGMHRSHLQRVLRKYSREVRSGQA